MTRKGAAEGGDRVRRRESGEVEDRRAAMEATAASKVCREMDERVRRNGKSRQDKKWFGGA